MRNAFKYFKFIFTVFLSIGFLSGCAMNQLVKKKVADALSGPSTVYASDDDVELVGQAIPFGLKLMETILEDQPKHSDLLLALSRGFTQYAYAYVQLPADKKESFDVAHAYQQRTRARRLYIRARDYGLRGLQVNYDGFNKELNKSPATAVTRLKKKDIGLVYWTAAAWGAAVSVGKNNPMLIADLPRIEALIYRAQELDESYDNGGIHTFLISYEMSKARSLADNTRRARLHLDRAIAISKDGLASPYLSYAQSVSVINGNRKEFESLLNKALAIDPNKIEEWRLVNTVMQDHARWLLNRTAYYFSD